jgi:hypothetical protein
VIYVSERTSSFNFSFVFVIQPGSTVEATSSVLAGSSFRRLNRELINASVFARAGAASILNFVAGHL